MSEKPRDLGLGAFWIMEKPIAYITGNQHIVDDSEMDKM